MASLYRTFTTRLQTFKQFYIGHPLRFFIATAKFACFTHIFLEYGFSCSPVAGPSMVPTFEVIGEWILISKLHRLGRNIEVGDLVAYKIPINDTVGVKRVLGMPGDYVMTVSPHHDRAASGREHMIQVPPGHCWIVGDNLPASRDSRQFGPVPLALVRGKVLAKVRSPFNYEWSLLGGTVRSSSYTGMITVLSSSTKPAIQSMGIKIPHPSFLSFFTRLHTRMTKYTETERT